MKVAFDKLKNKYKVLLIVILFLISLGLVVTSFILKNDLLRIGLASIALITLVFLFLMLIWYYMYKEKFKNNNYYENIDENKPIDLIVEYPKVLDEHFLRYVYVEGLTLATNLDKLTLGEQELTYVDDVDNKYDNEALALFYRQYKIGYFYKNGQFRELFRKLRNDKEYKVITKVCHLDLLNNKIKLKIGFYKTLESEKFDVIDASINNSNYDYLKVGYWLNVTKTINAIGKNVYVVNDIYGKELDVINNDKLDEYNASFYAKIVDINEKIGLKIYVITK